MRIETERLIIRTLIEQDAEALLELKYDEQIMKYHPTFFHDATADFIKDVISHFQGLAQKGLIYGKYGSLSAVCLKDSGEVIGFITLNRHLQANEWHIGWYFLSRYTRKGYASEAGAAASDYFLEALSLDYISAGVRDDNPASFRVAQKSGFKLIGKRIGFDHDNADCNAEDFNAVGEYFAKINHNVGSCEYYFQKFNKFNKTEAKKQSKPLSKLPIIALILTFTPTLLMLLSSIPFVGIIFAYLFAGSFWGASFHIIGIMVGVFCIISQFLFDHSMEEKGINIKGVIFSIISIVVPIVRWAIIISLSKNGSLELFL